jgi:hypothetical protein
MKDELRLHHMTEWRKKITGMSLKEAKEVIMEEKIIMKRRLISAEEHYNTRKAEFELMETFDVAKELDYIKTEGV